MARHQHNVSGGVWPGYVAAVAGLVQSLLFVSAVVATVVYLLGMLGSQQSAQTAQSEQTAQDTNEVAIQTAGLSPVRAPSLSTSQEAKERAKQDPRMPSLPHPSDRTDSLQDQTKTQAQMQAQTQALRPEYQLPKAFKPLELSFPAHQLQLDAATRQSVIQMAKHWVHSGASQWRLIGHAVDQDELSSRTAFFRLQEIRSLLIEQGVAPQAVEIRILPSAPPAFSDNKLLILATPVAAKLKETPNE